MAKKQITDQELLASQANAEFVNRNTEETVIESEADSLSLDEIKSNSIIHNSNDFDWDMDNKKLGGYSDAERAKLEVLYTTTLSSINKGEIISGTVVSMNTKDVVLNIGFKSDGMVPLSEFSNPYQITRHLPYPFDLLSYSFSVLGKNTKVFALLSEEETTLI